MPGMHGFLALTVRDAMTAKVVTVRPDTTVAELEALFERYDYNSLPVVSDDHLVGIVTKLDFLRNFVFTAESVMPHYDALMRRHVADIMSHDALTVTPEMPLSRALQIMVDRAVKSLPVVDGGALVGLIAREDVIRAIKRSEGS